MAVALTLIQISPLKWDPWSAIAKAVGRCINADLIRKLDEVSAQQQENRRLLDQHIPERVSIVLADAVKAEDGARL